MVEVLAVEDQDRLLEMCMLTRIEIFQGITWSFAMYYFLPF